MTPRLLIAGIGNIFFGDDAFGCEVAQRLLRRPRREGVTIADFGIRGLDLTYALLDGCDAAILIDAVARGQAPGTLFVLEPNIDSGSNAEPAQMPMIEAHSMDPAKVLRTVTTLGGRLNRVLVVGCEPSPADSEDGMRMGLSGAVEAVLDEAVALVESLVTMILDPNSPPALRGAAHHEEMQHDTPQPPV